MNRAEWLQLYADTPAGGTMNVGPTNESIGLVSITKPLNIVNHKDAEYDGISVTAKGSGGSFVGGRVIGKPTEATTNAHSAVKLTKVANYNVLGSQIEFGVHPVTGQLTGRALSVDGGSGIVINGTRQTNAFRGTCLLGGARNILVEENDIFGIRTSPIVGSNINDVIIEANRLRDSNPVGWGDTDNDGDHGDFIHLWNELVCPEMLNIRILRNIIDQGRGTALLGFLLQNKAGLLGRFQGEIRGNVLRNGNHNGFALSGRCEWDIFDNVLVPSPDSNPLKAPQVVFMGKDYNLEKTRIQRNIMSPGLHVGPKNYPDNVYLSPQQLASLTG